MPIRVEAPDLLSIQQAAMELAKPRCTIYRWVDKGKIIAIRLGGILFIPKSEVERLKGQRANELRERG